MLEETWLHFLRIATFPPIIFSACLPWMSAVRAKGPLHCGQLHSCPSSVCASSGAARSTPALSSWMRST
eukprot:6185983-Pleurochrysis_carterae.AAC.2